MCILQKVISLLDYHDIDKKQKDIDFLVPFLDVDRRYCVDPALLRFSGEKVYKIWNTEIEEFLKLVRKVIKSGDKEKLMRLLNIGEAPDIGLGYCEDGVKGSGFGKEISKNVIKILAKNPAFLKIGFFRLEELQWFDKEVGPDRVSDLVVHILKRELIKYTQKQCKKHGIPMEDVRVDKVFDGDHLEWVNMKTKLPVNPLRISKDALNVHPPVLLVPKDIIKPLPLFLNYDDFYGFIDSNYKQGSSHRKPKTTIVKRVIENPEISTQYIKSREIQKERLYRQDFDSDVPALVEELEQIKVGEKGKAANRYKDIVGELLCFVFDDLDLYDFEKKNILGTEQKDVILENNAKTGFLSDIKQKHGSMLIVVDAKNTDDVTAKDVAQVCGYLNDDIGRLAFIVSRKIKSNMRQHSYVKLKNEKKVVIAITDEDLKRWATDKGRIQQSTGDKLSFNDPVKALQRKYNDIMTD